MGAAGATSRATNSALNNCGDGGIYVRIDRYRAWVDSIPASRSLSRNEAQHRQARPRTREGPDAGAAPAPRAQPGRRMRRKPASPAGAVPLTIDVEWADIVRADGDVFVVGHYIGVLPQNAELALDIALSGTKEPSRLVLTDLTRRGAIRGRSGT